MSIAVICTGTELLKGSAVNTNLAFLGRELAAAGTPVALELCVGDRPEELAAALAAALRRADRIVVTGGLGPTADDITLETVCRFFGVETSPDPELVRKIEAFWRAIHTGHCPRNQFKQALVPEGGEVIPNPVGSASGIRFSADYGGRERTVFLAPGPPREFEPMAEAYLVPQLAALEGDERCTTCGFLAAGVGESTVSRAVETALAGVEVEIAYTASEDGTRVYLSGTAATVEAAVELARTALAPAALPAGACDLADYLVEQLRNRGWQLNTAESCTGGMIAGLLTDIAGVSDVFTGGVVTYSNELKRQLLDVPAEVLEQFGAVSSECASAMAAGARRKLGGDCAVAVTGIAGPGGGTPEKPVGLVFIAAETPWGAAVRRFEFRGDRAIIRRRARARALLLLWELLRNDA